MEGVFTKFKIFVLVVLLGLTNVFAQTGTGKLAGKITDAQTGEPLIGANVIIMNSNLGAATDIDGNYFILNITPGTYDVKISYVGYSSKIVQEVRIVAGITYELNESLSSGIDLEEIIVTDTKFFEEKSTNTVKVVDSDQISKLPVKGVANIASLQAGVVIAEGSGGADGNATINVRGGRGSEVLYIVDGVAQNNLFGNTSAAQVSNSAIEQLSFQVGGYEAKYGQAQSGIINITTKSGNPNYSIYADVLTSEFTDDYGYNLYTLNLSGPIIPGQSDHTFFFSGERGWYADATPSAIDLEFPTVNKTYDALPENSAGNYRFTGRTKHNFGPITANLSANINLRNGRQYIHSYAKNNAIHFPEFDQNNYSFSGRFSHTISNNTFYNLTLGFRRFNQEQYDPVLGTDLMLWGDSTYFEENFDVTLIGDGQRVIFDDNGVFFDTHRINNLYDRRENDTYTLDFDFTSQIDNHLLEFGGGFQYHLLRLYQINPINPVMYDETLSLRERYESLQPTVYGYDVFGDEKTSLGDDDYAPKNPIFGYVYLQDRFELEDLVLNLGLRMDYFDTGEDILANPSLPFGGGSDPANFDDGDFTEKEPEVKFSPRIGLGFPVTETTVFHAQYGKFIQLPQLFDLYNGPFDLLVFQQMQPQYVRDGQITSEETTQYEIGFRQVIGSNAALNITAFYKNIRGLVNRENHLYSRNEGGEVLRYIAPTNADFGTTKGLAFSLDVSRLSYFSISTNYTFSIAEGTGSSTNSSQTAVFRNLDGLPPAVIAPLDFDQTHTATVNVDFYIPEGEAGFLEMFNANLLLSYASGRPYTPLDYFDILSGNNGGPSTTGYVNSRRMPSTFRIDLKVEKSFKIGNGLFLTPYLWIENLLDADNVVNVWRSTGDPYTTGYLLTEDGKNNIENRGSGYELDYKSLERDPGNFGIPRLIKLGFKVNFANIGL
jgi:outer membrane receptor protein involved in Fe transport